MSDTPSAPSDAAPTPPPRIDPAPPKLPPPGAAKPPRRPAPRVPATLSLCVILIVALALVGTSPYWAPPLMPLLPWSTAQEPQQQPSPTQDQTTQQLAAIQQQLDQLTRLSNRVSALENRPAPDASAAVAPLAGQVQQLDARIDQIDKLLVQLTRDAANNAESPQRVLIDRAGESRQCDLHLAPLRRGARKRRGAGSESQRLGCVVATAGSAGEDRHTQRGRADTAFRGRCRAGHSSRRGQCAEQPTESRRRDAGAAEEPRHHSPRRWQWRQHEQQPDRSSHR